MITALVDFRNNEIGALILNFVRINTVRVCREIRKE